MSYAEVRKYQDLLIGETFIPDLEDAAVKEDNDPEVKAKHTETLTRLQKAKQSCCLW